MFVINIQLFICVQSNTFLFISSKVRYYIPWYTQSIIKVLNIILETLEISFVSTNKPRRIQGHFSVPQIYNFLYSQLQSEREKFGSYDFSAARCNLNALCQRIHKLDEMSKKVLQDVETMEVAVDEAEAHLINSTEGKIKNLLKPLLFVSIILYLPNSVVVGQ